jgi:hypothetical protein
LVWSYSIIFICVLHLTHTPHGPTSMYTPLLLLIMAALHVCHAALASSLKFIVTPDGSSSPAQLVMRRRCVGTVAQQKSPNDSNSGGQAIRQRSKVATCRRLEEGRE